MMPRTRAKNIGDETDDDDRVGRKNIQAFRDMVSLASSQDFTRTDHSLTDIYIKNSPHTFLNDEPLDGY